MIDHTPASQAANLTKWAERMGLTDARVEYQQVERYYVLYVGDTEEYRSQQAEAIACHIDMLAIARRFSQ